MSDKLSLKEIIAEMEWWEIETRGQPALSREGKPPLRRWIAALKAKARYTK